MVHLPACAQALRGHTRAKGGLGFLLPSIHSQSAAGNLQDPPGHPMYDRGSLSLDFSHQLTKKKVIWVFTVESLKDAKFKMYILLWK